MTSWAQFFKNMPIGLILFLILESSIFTREYRKGTLVLTLTKGLARSQMVLAKAAVLLSLWSVLYWFSFAVTYGCNALLWDNGIAENLILAVLGFWLMGVFTLSLAVFFSTVAGSNILVLVGTGGVILLSYLLSLLPKVGSYSPAFLMNSTPLLAGAADQGSYLQAVAVTVLLSLIAVAVSIPIFDKKQL